MKCAECETVLDLSAEFAAHDEEKIDIQLHCRHCEWSASQFLAIEDFVENE